MSDYTVQDLLSIIGEETPEKESSPAYSSKIGEFVDEFKLISGVDRIPNYVIYFTYKERFGGELSKIEFFRQFNKEFISVRTGKQRCYLLDKSSFDLSREGLLEAEHHGEKEKEQKRSGRVSRSRRKNDNKKKT
jgi:hypothetical protein